MTKRKQSDEFFNETTREKNDDETINDEKRKNNKTTTPRYNDLTTSK